jgi:hypothetical protein
MPRLGKPCWSTWIAAVSAAAGLAFGVPSASAVTIGQLAQTPEVNYCEVNPYDLLQPTVTSGNSYVVPSTGGVTSWTVNSWSTSRAANPVDQSGELKVFRKVSDPTTFTVVGHEGPHDLVGGVNTFPASVRVNAGDVLGAHFVGGGACGFEVFGDTALIRIDSDLGDGQSAAFDPSEDDRVNVSAEITPTSDFTLGKVKARNNGRATVQVTVPNPGQLKVAGKGVRGSFASAVAAKQVAAGTTKVVIRAKGKKKRKLAAKGKVTVAPKISFTPAGGQQSSVSRKIKLRRK